MKEKQIVVALAIVLVQLFGVPVNAAKPYVITRTDVPSTISTVDSDEGTQKVADTNPSTNSTKDKQQSTRDVLTVTLDAIDYNSTKAHIEEKSVQLNYRPIIGIVAQKPGKYMTRAFDKISRNDITSYIGASYVKSIEAAGARVVPVLTHQPEEYYENLFNSLNGFVIPGGGVSITNSSGYGQVADMLYQMILSANAAGTVTPLWTTCLGFETLVYLAAGRRRPLTRCNASDKADPLHLTPDWESSRLFSTAPSWIMEAASSRNITSNFHKYCVLNETFYELGVDEHYRILSTNYDYEEVEYISTIEHKDYPIYGTQWHPEKAAYEWKYGSTIPHTPDAIALEHHTTGVFVDHARHNNNRFPGGDAEAERWLIYNYSPTFVRRLYPSSFQQVYVFTANDTGDTGLYLGY